MKRFVFYTVLKDLNKKNWLIKKKFAFFKIGSSMCEILKNCMKSFIELFNSECDIEYELKDVECVRIYNMV